MPAGRPTKYHPGHCEVAAEMCRNGATEETISKHFGVGYNTLYEWRKKYPEFQEAIKAAKSEHDDEVEAALLKRAKGYEHTHQAINKFGDVVQIEKHLPPDPVSMIFWLKNRQPQRWRDKQDHEHSGPNGGAITINVNLDPTPKKDGV